MIRIVSGLVIACVGLLSLLAAPKNVHPGFGAVVGVLFLLVGGALIFFGSKGGSR